MASGVKQIPKVKVVIDILWWYSVRNNYHFNFMMCWFCFFTSHIFRFSCDIWLMFYSSEIALVQLFDFFLKMLELFISRIGSYKQNTTGNKINTFFKPALCVSEGKTTRLGSFLKLPVGVGALQAVSC